MKLFCVKHNNVLVPARESVDDMDAIKQGKVVVVEVTQARNVQHHRLFFAMVKVVWDNVDRERYPTQDALRAALTISAGHRLEYQLPNGQAYFLPKSIAFHAMDQIAFSEFFERCLDAINLHFMPNAKEEVRKQISEMTGLAA